MRTLLWPLVLSLAACEAPSATTSDVRGGANASAPARSVDVPPAAAAEPRGERVPAFPAAFQGRWGLVAKDCDGGSAAKGLMRIEGNTVRFYESRGVTSGLDVDAPTRVAGEFTFDGEGQRWQNTQTFDLTSGGDTLVRSETDPAGSYTYKRCDLAK